MGQHLIERAPDESHAKKQSTPTRRLQHSSFGHDSTVAVTLGEWKCDGQEEEWEFAVLLRDFRALNAVTIRDAYPLPRIDESSLTWVRPRFTPVLIWLGFSGKYQYARQIDRIL